MAATVLTLKFTYENAVDFKMELQRDAGPVDTIVSLEENGSISLIWPHVALACEAIFDKEITDIGNVMKS